jgi:hypothetical protein
VAMALMLPAARTYSDGLVPAVEASQAATAE